MFISKRDVDRRTDQRRGRESCDEAGRDCVAVLAQAQVETVVCERIFTRFVVYNNFFFLSSNLLAKTSQLCETLPQLSIRWNFEGNAPILPAEATDLEKKLENFLAAKLYDFVFSYKRREYAEQRKNWCEGKKSFLFFRSESANLSWIFFQSIANFLPIFHFYMIFDHLINIFNATQLIFDFTLTRNKRN